MADTPSTNSTTPSDAPSREEFVRIVCALLAGPNLYDLSTLAQTAGVVQGIIDTHFTD